MGTIYTHRDGYMMFKSDNGIRYELLEGKTMGGDRVYTSDKVIVMLDYYDFLNDVDEMVGWFFGATDLEKMDEDTIKYLDYIVSRWEDEHKDIVDWILSR